MTDLRNLNRIDLASLPRKFELVFGPVCRILNENTGERRILVLRQYGGFEIVCVSNKAVLSLRARPTDDESPGPRTSWRTRSAGACWEPLFFCVVLGSCGIDNRPLVRRHHTKHSARPELCRAPTTSPIASRSRGRGVHCRSSDYHCQCQRGTLNLLSGFPESEISYPA